MISGMEESRLERIGKHLDKYVADGKLPGASILVSRDQKEMYYHETGYADVERKVPVARDTVFRIYSMTKPITSVALLSLYEHGLFQLDDPVSKYIPEWENLKVYESGEGDSIKTREPIRPMIIKDLLTHTSGLTYGFMNSHPVDKLYRDNQIGGAPGLTLKDMIGGLAEIPLLYDPGSRWNYSVSTDVCGYLVELFSGQSLDEYVDQTVLQPLYMGHSGFKVKPADKTNLAACYNHHPEGFRLQDDPKGSRYHETPTFLSGGGGMVCTIDDYMSFAICMQGYPVIGNAPVLGNEMVSYALKNHLPGGADLAGMGQSVFAETSFEGVGFGLGFSVVVDPVAASVLDSVGSAGWGGAASTYFWVDPAQAISVVFMTQLLPSSTFPIRRELKTLVNQAIVDNQPALGFSDIFDDIDYDQDDDFPDLSGFDDNIRH